MNIIKQIWRGIDSFEKVMASICLFFLAIAAIGWIAFVFIIITH